LSPVFFGLLLLNIPVEAEEVADTTYHNDAILSMAAAEPNYVEALAVKNS
jgi:hypothetical protein